MLRFSFLLLAGTALAQQYTITTIAGGAPPSTPAAALSTTIGQPRRLALAGSNLYFSSGHSVFKIDGSGTLTLLAGNSRPGFSGDGGPAVNAQLNAPQGLAVDAGGNVYIADSLNNRVRKVDSKGIITTFAGNGITSEPGFWGDGGPATDANIKMPTGLAIASDGSVYIAVSADNTIRKVTPDGVINIFAGQGYKGYFGDFKKDDISGNVLSDGVAVRCGLTGPQDVLVNSKGEVFIADTGNQTIRKVDTSGIITTVSGNGGTGTSGDDVATTLAMSTPMSLALDSNGNLFIAEFGTNRIRRLNTSTGKIDTAIGDGIPGFAGDAGPANKVEMNLPTGVAVDGSGNLYFADSLNNRIRRLSGGNVNTFAGNGGLSRSGDGGPAASAQLNLPTGVAVDAAGNTYISDTANHVVRRVSTSGVITNYAGTGTPGNAGDGGAAASAQLNSPQGLAVDSSGNLYIADAGNHKVRKVTNGTISTLAGSGTAGFGGDGGAAGSALLNLPYGVALDAAGNVYIAEFASNRVRRVGTNGNIATIAGNGVSGYSGDGGQATSAMLNGPQSVAVDGNGNVYIADTGNNRVRRVTAGGAISTFAGIGGAGSTGDGGPATSAIVGNPVAVAIDSVGNLYIADGSSRIRKVFLSGVISTIAGTGAQGYSGDGGAALNARLNGPDGIALASNGTVLVSDSANNAVRALQVASAGITVSAVTNGASNLSGPVAPGEVIAIYGSGMGPSAVVQYQPGVNGQVPFTTGGTSVIVNGVNAPVLYTSANQVGAVVPFGVNGSVVQVVVAYQNGASAPFNVAVASQIPAIFTLNGSGTGQAAAINNKDGGINGAGKPAKVGDYVQLYVTGVGQTTPGGTDGAINTAPLPSANGVKVTIGGQNATVSFAGGAPGSVQGVIQVNALIPSGITVGNAVPVVVQVGTSNSQPGVTLAISN